MSFEGMIPFLWAMGGALVVCLLMAMPRVRSSKGVVLGHYGHFLDTQLTRCSRIRRVAAFILDVGFIAVLTLATLAGMAAIAVLSDAPFARRAILILENETRFNIFYFAFYIAYWVFFEIWPLRVSPGKKMFGVFLAKRSGEEISGVASFSRLFVFYFREILVAGLIFYLQVYADKSWASSIMTPAHIYMLLGLIAFGLLHFILTILLILFREDKRGLHDILTGTHVLRRKPAVSPSGFSGGGVEPTTESS